MILKRWITQKSNDILYKNSKWIIVVYKRWNPELHTYQTADRIFDFYYFSDVKILCLINYNIVIIVTTYTVYIIYNL